MTAASNVARTWQQIAEEASHETDPNRLQELAEELERALDARDKLPSEPPRVA